MPVIFLEAKKPAALVLENVKLLVAHNKGQTIQRIMETLNKLGYHTTYKVLNALDFGLPQKRERVFIVGITYKNRFVKFLSQLFYNQTLKQSISGNS